MGLKIAFKKGDPRKVTRHRQQPTSRLRLKKKQTRKSNTKKDRKNPNKERPTETKRRVQRFREKTKKPEKLERAAFGVGKRVDSPEKKLTVLKGLPQNIGKNTELKKSRRTRRGVRKEKTHEDKMALGGGSRGTPWKRGLPARANSQGKGGKGTLQGRKKKKMFESKREGKTAITGAKPEN